MKNFMLYSLSVALMLTAAPVFSADQYVTPASECDSNSSLTADNAFGLANNTGSSKLVFCGLPWEDGVTTLDILYTQVTDGVSTSGCTLRHSGGSAYSPNGTTTIGPGVITIDWTTNRTISGSEYWAMQCEIPASELIYGYLYDWD